MKTFQIYADMADFQVSIYLVNDTVNDLQNDFGEWVGSTDEWNDAEAMCRTLAEGEPYMIYDMNADTFTTPDDDPTPNEELKAHTTYGKLFNEEKQAFEPIHRMNGKGYGWHINHNPAGTWSYVGDVPMVDVFARLDDAVQAVFVWLYENSEYLEGINPKVMPDLVDAVKEIRNR